MKIALVIHSLKIGGMERVMAELANNFSQRNGTEIHLILIGRHRTIHYPLLNDVLIHQPEFKFDNSRRNQHTLKTGMFLRKKIKELNPDVILSFGEIWNNLVLLSLFGLNIPIYISDRSTPGKDLGKLHNFLRNNLYPTAQGYVAQTNKAKEICLQNRWNNNVRVIGNPIRNNSSSAAIKKEKIVLFVGRLIRTKHVDQLIEMFHEVRLPGWKLEIVGGDAKKLKLSESYKRLIITLGAEKYITLEGEQINVDEYYQHSSIFAFPSSSEGFPNVVGEAMSAGLPVISYDCIAGPSEMIEHDKDGYLVPVFNGDIFKDRLNLLMRDGQRRHEMSKAAQRSIINFDPEIIGEKYFQFITQ